MDRCRDWWTSRRSSVPSGISSWVALEVSNHLDTHGAEQRCFTSIELRPEHDLPKGAHHALRSPSLEEVDGPERAGPIGEQLLELFRRCRICLVAWCLQGDVLPTPRDPAFIG